MKILRFFISRVILKPILPFTALLILLNISCKPEDQSGIDYEFQTIETLFFPKKDISLVFNIVPKGNNEPLKIKWINPDSLKVIGPYSVVLNSNLLLDFEISDAQNFSKRFTHELMNINDSLKYDYRNNCIGTYVCSVNYSFDGTTKIYKDTLTVIKNNDFKMLNILTIDDILKNFAGNKMTYLNRSNRNSIIKFYGYHSGVSFSNDSIHYSANGQLGNYYARVYNGVKIKK